MSAGIKRALISVTDKTGIVDFARALKGMKVEIISTGGSAVLLRSAGVEVIDVSSYTGFPEILSGRVKTLHPKIHGGVLAIRDNSEHQTQMQANGIKPIDLLVVNLYAFEQTVAKEGVSFEDAIENIDIGGPTLIRAAAKNHEFVSVVTDPSDYSFIVEEMKSGGGLSRATRFKLAKKAFSLTAAYDAAIASYLTKMDDEKKLGEWPDRLYLVLDKVSALRYGENPHQPAAFYGLHKNTSLPSIVKATQLGGRELSYNNIMDADTALAVVADLCDYKFAAAIVKHANPCGVAVSDLSLFDALERAVNCDPVSAFGGIIAVTGPLDADCARLIVKTFFEVVVASSFEEEAVDILTAKKNLRLLEVGGMKSGTQLQFAYRGVAGGLLVQRVDAIDNDIRESKVVTKRRPTEEEWNAMQFAWIACKHVKSNAIVYANAKQTIGIGAGQTSRLDSSKIAVLKACMPLNGAAVASDAFFPFRDGLDEAAGAGVSAVVQPGGSVRDEEVIAAANEHNMTMIFTGVRHFRH